MSSSGLAAFPDRFLWGAATSAYQIEGATTAGGRGVSIWDAFCRVPGATWRGETGEVATDHYHRFRDDVALMAEIGLRAYRFSIAWPRIQPEGRGPALAAGLDFYNRLTDALLEAGVEPMIALHHWDLPQALEDRGGWPARDTAHRFADFADIVVRALHDRVRLWGTINEPWGVFTSYAAGTSAPGKRDPAGAIDAAHHILLAHGLAVAATRAIDAVAQLGIFLNLHPVHPAGPQPSPSLMDAVRRIDALQNRLFLDPLLTGGYPNDAIADLRPFGRLPVQPGDLELIAAPLDWLGINYYFDRLIEPGGDAEGLGLSYPGVSGVREVPAVNGTDMGWPITPAGLHGLLVRLYATYNALPPILITENGAAYDDPPGPDGLIEDPRRIAYLEAHIRQVHRAIADGVDVRGYFVWSALDNFEWSFGYARRFGLIHVDYATQRRTPRASAWWYKAVIERNGLIPPNEVARHSCHERGF